MKMFKIALNAGHYFYEPGRRVSRAFDSNETREWVLNARICEKVEQKLKAYEGYTLLRIDDRTGETPTPLNDRTAKANRFGADIYVSVHHNAGVAGGSGGGIMAFTYLTVDEPTRRLQRLLYEKLIEKTGLIGNRATPLATADFAECRQTVMPAVLLECGFMDSSTDAPIIITDTFAEKAAQAITEAIVEYGQLKPVKTSDPAPAEPTGPLYRVQVGAFKEKANAEALAEQLKKEGYSVYIKRE